jgi:RimJ/RimL family protein N-acetyltransferase
MVLETPRLVLRPPEAEDFEAWAAMMADEEAARFIGGKQSRAEAWRSICTMAGAWSIRGFSVFSVIEREGGRWIGRIGPWQPEGWPGTEVGWALAREAWGKGYAFEAAVTAMAWVFETLGWTEVIHCIAPENLRSVRLAERLGSRWQRRALLPAPRNVWVEIYGQSREEWQRQQTTRR